MLKGLIVAIGALASVGATPSAPAQQYPNEYKIMDGHVEKEFVVSPLPQVRVAARSRLGSILGARVDWLCLHLPDSIFHCSRVGESFRCPHCSQPVLRFIFEFRPTLIRPRSPTTFRGATSMACLT